MTATATRRPAAGRAGSSVAVLAGMAVVAVLAVVVGYPWTVLPIGTPVLEGWLETAEPFAAPVLGQHTREVLAMLESRGPDEAG